MMSAALLVPVALVFLMVTVEVIVSVQALKRRARFFEAKLDELIDLARYAPLETGVCMCGDAVDEHTQAHGHGPVDIWDHAFEKFQESLCETPALGRSSPATS